MSAPKHCIVCGGTDFYKSIGYYYCEECQTRCEDVREAIVENEDNSVNQDIETSSSRRLSRQKTVEKKDARISIWEYYNYYLFGIVKEVIALGVNEHFKKTVESLWFRYLQRMEVIDMDDATALPKLHSLNSLDQEVIYGQKVNRPRKIKKAGEKTVVFDEKRLKKRRYIRTLMNAEHQKESKNIQSTHSRTLDELSFENKPKSNLKFSKAAIEAYIKVLGEEHFQEHLDDVENKLTCHIKVKRLELPSNFYRSFHSITRAKIYTFIYLALLINKDNVHYADIVRYINEGHLTFRYYKHFFEGVDVEPFNEKCELFCNVSMRNSLQELIGFLGVGEFVPMQDMVSLCIRYCKELNLPGSISDCVIRLLGKSQPKLKAGKNTRNRVTFPNFEGRAISFIIFTLKLLFGLDGLTEFKFSKLANLINQNSQRRSKTQHFNFQNWLHHILYRKLVINHHHIPSYFESNNTTCPGEDASTYVDFLKTQDKVLYIGRENINKSQFIPNLLSALKGRINRKSELLNFPPSLTPFRDYTKVILNSKIADEREYLTDVLKQDFHKHSIDFLVNTENYVKANVKHRGAIKRFNILKCVNSERRDYRFTIPAYETTLVDDEDYEFEAGASNTEEVVDVVQLHEEMYSEIFTGEMKDSSSRNRIQSKEYKLHYKPEDSFWIYAYDINNFRQDEFDKYYVNLPLSFRVIVEECSRMLNTTPRHLMDDYLHLEVYLSFVFDPTSQKLMEFNVLGNDEVLESLIPRARDYW